MNDFDQKDWDEKYIHIAREAGKAAEGGTDSHMAIDYELLLSEGIEGIINKIDSITKDNIDPEKQVFYKNCRRCLEGVALLSERYSQKAKELASACKDEEYKTELLKISEICKKVPFKPAETFYEAMQSVNFITYCLSFNPLRLCHQQFQLGHPDRYLMPFYEKGDISPDAAQELFDCLGVQTNHRVINGLSSGYMLGGRDKDGKVVANDLTMMGLQTIDNLKLVFPAAGLCYTEEMPDEYLIKACEILSHGCSHPAIFNDDIIRAGLLEYGVSEEDSFDYIHSTCVEITPGGASNVWVATPYTNLLEILLSAMNKDYSSFADFRAAVLDILSERIRKNFEKSNAERKFRAENAVNPLLSCFVKDCIALGKDIENGGGRYNWIMPSFVGMANMVDSLYAIKKLVFDEKELTALELKEILDNNFKDNQELRARILNKLPKYGNDIDEVDNLAKDVTEFIVNECKKHTPIHQNARLVPSVFCWIMHEALGHETGASPDGRPAFFPLGDGSGPAQGREMNGPTASVLSSTKWSHKEFIGGVAVNMKFGKKNFTEESVKNILALIKTYMKRGGFEMQINVVDRETLLKAKKDPERYKDLVVRIGGYSDYFVKLSPKMQEEVLLRTEHEI